MHHYGQDFKPLQKVRTIVKQIVVVSETKRILRAAEGIDDDGKYSNCEAEGTTTTE